MKVIFRLKKIKSEKTVNEWKSHNFRERLQQNIKEEDSAKNIILIDEFSMKERNKALSISDYYKNKGIKVKEGNVVAIDGIITMSPEFFNDKTHNDVEEWAKHQLEFINIFFDNVKEVVLHLDEKTPHIHFLATTEKESVKRYKNRYGEGARTTTTLNTTWMDKLALSQLQQIIYDHNKEKYSYIQPRTIKNKEQVKRNHIPLKEYYASIANRNDELLLENEELKKENTRLKTELEKEKIIDEVSNRLFHVKQSKPKLT